MPKIQEGMSNSMTVDSELAHEPLFHPSHDLWDIKNWYNFLRHAPFLLPETFGSETSYHQYLNSFIRKHTHTSE